MGNAEKEEREEQSEQSGPNMRRQVIVSLAKKERKAMTRRREPAASLVLVRRISMSSILGVNIGAARAMIHARGLTPSHARGWFEAGKLNNSNVKRENAAMKPTPPNSSYRMKCPRADAEVAALCYTPSKWLLAHEERGLPALALGSGVIHDQRLAQGEHLPTGLDFQLGLPMALTYRTPFELQNWPGMVFDPTSWIPLIPLLPSAPPPPHLL
ncbi:hypothetical protein F5877DRAFT_73589, partial [Lentinula edodes]